jgi:GTP pyrophosphokinase
VPLRTELRNGDRVEIITASNAKPNPAWLGYVTTSKARSHIRHFLKTMQSGESAQLGERLLNQALNALGIKTQDMDEAHWNKLLKDTGVKTRQDILADIGLGRRLNMVVARQLARVDAMPREPANHAVVTIQGTEGMAVQFASCCRPIPGDPIIGVIKNGQGLVVHTHDCPTLRRGRSGEQWLDVAWDKNIVRPFDVNIKLMVANQRGVLAKIAAAIAEAEANIENINFTHEDEHTALYFTLEVNNRLHLANIMRSLRRIQEVVRIIRVKNAS